MIKVTNNNKHIINFLGKMENDIKELDSMVLDQQSVIFENKCELIRCQVDLEDKVKLLSNELNQKLLEENIKKIVLGITQVVEENKKIKTNIESTKLICDMANVTSAFGAEKTNIDNEDKTGEIIVNKTKMSDNEIVIYSDKIKKINELPYKKSDNEIFFTGTDEEKWERLLYLQI